MANLAVEAESGALRLDFNRRLTLQFHGSVMTSDVGLLAYRELDDALRLIALAGKMLADARSGKNGGHALVGSCVREHLRKYCAQMAGKIATIRLKRRSHPGNPEVSRYH